MVATTHEAIVLAGGLGTRLAGVIGDCPKGMAPVAGRPFLEWQLDYLITQEITRVVLSVGHLADRIISHFGARYRSVEIVYSREASPRGTGGALKSALDRVDGAAAFALNGDTLLLADLSRVEGGADDALVLTVRKVDDASRYGTVTCDENRVVGFRNKGVRGTALANAGTYWLRRGTVAPFAIDESFSFESEFLARYLSALRPRAVVVDGFFADIGEGAAYSAAQSSIPPAFATFLASGHFER